MKATFTFAVVAAIVAVACAAPGNILAVDWEEAKVLNGELADVIHKTVETINATALNDNQNQAAGKKVSTELKKADAEAFKNFIPIVNGIDIQNLRVSQTRDYLRAVADVFTDFLENVNDSIQQLSPSAQDTIKKAYETGSKDAKEAAEKLFVALRGQSL